MAYIDDYNAYFDDVRRALQQPAMSTPLSSNRSRRSLAGLGTLT